MHAALPSIVALWIAGCAAYSGAGLRPGQAREADVARVMGTPAERYAVPGGGAVWAYPHGPQGRETYMARFDAAGVLASLEQVLDERGFAQVRLGDTPEVVRRALGPPNRVARFAARGETVWDYRFRDAWQLPAQFHVVFDRTDRVVSTQALREAYGGNKASH